MATCFKVLASLTICLLIGVRLQAEDTAAPMDEAQVALWVKQLEADDFAEREAASKALVAAGSIAVQQVSQAAQGESLEAATRAFTILDRWLRSGQQPMQNAARESLARLVETGNGSNVQRLAKAILAKNLQAMQDNSSQGAMEAVQFAFGAEFPVPVFMLDGIKGVVDEVVEVEAAPAIVMFDPFGALEEVAEDAIWEDLAISVEPPVLEVESPIELELPAIDVAEEVKSP